MGEEAGLKGSGNGRSPEQIQANIEQTRAELGETVNAIREKLSPGRFKRQMFEKVRNATLGRARNMMETSTEKAKELGSMVADKAQKNPVGKAILDNPVPAVLAAAGIGAASWLIWRRAGKAPGEAEASAGKEFENPLAESCGCTGERSQETAGTAAARAREIVGRGRERAGEAMGKAREKAGEVFEQAKEKAGQLGTATRERARVLRERSRGAVQEKPLLIAAAALGAGVLIGLILPGTDRERKWFGRMKERLFGGTGESSEGQYGQTGQEAGERSWPAQGQPGDLNL